MEGILNFALFRFVFIGVDGISLDMVNIVDIRSQNNYEIAVRISTDVENHGREFYTDLNGFQVLSIIYGVNRLHSCLGFDSIW